MGDLMVTCWSKLGRNRRAGELIAQGRTPAEALAEIGQVVEGLTRAPLLRDLRAAVRVDMPITNGRLRRARRSKPERARGVDHGQASEVRVAHDGQ